MNELLNKLIKWDSAARKYYTYEYDKVLYGKSDKWVSKADDVLAGKAWKGDCDDLGSTVLDLLLRDGYPKKYLYRCLVNTKGFTDKIDHFIALASDGNAMYVIGDTFGPIYPLKKIKHKIVAVSNVTDGLKWKRVQHNSFIS
jgi:hypothetical protein